MSAEDDARLLAWVENQRGIAAAKARFEELYSHPSESADDLLADYSPALDAIARANREVTE